MAADSFNFFCIWNWEDENINEIYIQPDFCIQPIQIKKWF